MLTATASFVSDVYFFINRHKNLENLISSDGGIIFVHFLMVRISGKRIPYKQKIWLEKYLAESMKDHSGEIKFGGSRVANTIEFAIGELNLVIFTKNRQPPNLIPCQIFWQKIANRQI